MYFEQNDIFFLDYRVQKSSIVFGLSKPCQCIHVVAKQASFCQQNDRAEPLTVSNPDNASTIIAAGSVFVT